MTKFTIFRHCLGMASCLLLAVAYYNNTNVPLMQAACVAGATWFVTLFFGHN